METFNLPNHEIISIATMLVKRFEGLHEFATEKKIKLPTDYKPKRKMGTFYLTNAKPKSMILEALGFPERYIATTKSGAARWKKEYALINEPWEIVSSQTSLGKAGCLKVGDKIITIEGRTPHENEALAILLTYQSSQMSAAEFMDLQKKIKNPYLENQILDFLLLTVPKQGIYFA